MKKNIFLIIFFCTLSIGAFAQQATMPTIIIFPDDTWMKDHGFMKTKNDNGEVKYIPQYNDAFVNNRDLGTAIQAVQKVFTSRQFEHKDLQNLLKDIQREHAEDLANAADGSGVEPSSMDELLQQAGADIRVDLDYSVRPFGARNSITFRMKAVDAYISNQIASCEGTVQGTMDPLDLALRKIVAGKSEEFCQQIVDYFRDLRDNGRKITVIFKAVAGSGINLAQDEITEDGDTYSDFLYTWLCKHAVNNACSAGKATKSRCVFDVVRIPFFDENNLPLKTDRWANGIRKAFREETGIKIVRGQGNTLGRVNFEVGK